MKQLVFRIAASYRTWNAEQNTKRWWNVAIDNNRAYLLERYSDPLGTGIRILYEF